VGGRSGRGGKGLQFGLMRFPRLVRFSSLCPGSTLTPNVALPNRLYSTSSCASCVKNISHRSLRQNTQQSVTLPSQHGFGTTINKIHIPPLTACSQVGISAPRATVGTTLTTIIVEQHGGDGTGSGGIGEALRDGPAGGLDRRRPSCRRREGARKVGRWPCALGTGC